MTCRTFGPATRTLEGEAVGHCELCYAGIAAEEVARCAVDVDPDGVEATLLADLDRLGASGTACVADAVRRA